MLIEPPTYFLQDGADQLEVFSGVLAGCVLHKIALSDKWEKFAIVCGSVALLNCDNGRVGCINNKRLVFFELEGKLAAVDVYPIALLIVFYERFYSLISEIQ